MDCKVCQIPFNEEEHKPRHAPCGHGLCTACLRALIKDSIYECPTCRQKNKVFDPEDLPVNYDLIDMIRTFKSMMSSSSSIKGIASEFSGASNNDICKVHPKPIEHRCLTCKVWICNICLNSHSTSMGCSTLSSMEAMKNIKEKHSKNADSVVEDFECKSKYLLSEIQNHEAKIQELQKEAQLRSEEITKIQNSLEQGKSHKDKLLKSKDNLNAINSPYKLMDDVDIFVQMKQSLKSWTLENSGADKKIQLLRELKAVKEKFVEVEHNNQKLVAKLSEHGDNIYVHNFRERRVPFGITAIQFDYLEKMIPSDASLLFLELSIRSVVKGRVLIRLNRLMPNIREHLVNIAIGQAGKSLSGLTLNCNKTWIGNNNLDFSTTPVNIDSFLTSNKVSTGDVYGFFGYGYLYSMFLELNHGNTMDYKGSWRIFGYVEEGLDILQELQRTNNRNVDITGCGIVIEQN